MRHSVRPRVTAAITTVADAAAIAIALAIIHMMAGQPTPLSAIIATALANWALAVFANGPGLTCAAQALRLMSSVFLSHGLVLIAAVFVASPPGAVLACVGSALLSAALLLLSRALLHETLAHRRWWGWPVAVLGDDPAAVSRIEAALRLHTETGLKPVVALREHRGGSRACGGLRCVHGPGALDRLRHRFGISHVVSMRASTSVLLLLRIDVATPYFGKMSLYRRLGPLIGLRPVGTGPKRAPSRAKRALDLAATAIGMIVAAPLMVLIAALIRLDSDGPTMFRQKRPGKDGALFRIFKFRTMFVGAARMRNALTAELQKELETYGKIRHDPRVTRVGRWLRRTSLDELPQVINVLRGDMSLVGPRPHLMHQRARLVSEHRAALRATPGITGLWQISGRSSVPFDVRLAMDAYYAEVANLWLDLYILARTVVVVASGKGAY